ncbi:lanthionine synthetase C family protein [Polymorphospora sp. NPDC051019]|uniref:lanthionine synthetase C family protein n=1 Tax=Polymorphospora sp. NPDC051019 TaxID=3155725 RepID=UPI00341C4A62
MKRRAGSPARIAESIAHTLAAPDPGQVNNPQRHSLATGDLGTALAHIERAHIGVGDWQTVHAWVTAAAGDTIGAADTGAYFGAPALSVLLHAAGADGVPRYGATLAALDAHLAIMVHRRADAAMNRIDRRDDATFGEYDLFRGLTGLGAHLLHRAPGTSALERILVYLVALTKPNQRNGERFPGWWVSHDPHLRQASGGGHANLGVAHGIAGPLALLAQAMRRQVTVAGHTEAITTILDWLDRWQQTTNSGPWWPQWITLSELRTGRPSSRGPHRPSWCYGTPGIARAQQLAGIALGDETRQRAAENALTACLSDPQQLRQIRDNSLCHGWAGLYQTAWRSAQDARTPAVLAHLPHLAHHLCQERVGGEQQGLLEGQAGRLLALHTAVHGAPRTGWDAYLLLN